MIVELFHVQCEFKMIENEAKNRYNSIKQFHSVLRFCKPPYGYVRSARTLYPMIAVFHSGPRTSHVLAR